jgi:hypothetical protein
LAQVISVDAFEQVLPSAAQADELHAQPADPTDPVHVWCGPHALAAPHVPSAAQIWTAFPEHRI